MILALSLLECTMMPWSKEHNLHKELYTRSGDTGDQQRSNFSKTIPKGEGVPLLFLLLDGG